MGEAGMERYCDNDGVEHENCNVMYSLSDSACVVLYADAQRALDAERAESAMAKEAYWSTIADLRSELATLQAQLAAEQQRADRSVQDRRDVLDVKTKEGMSCSEWLMRTATAERQVNELKAQLRQVGEERDEARRESNVFYKKALEFEHTLFGQPDQDGSDGLVSICKAYKADLTALRQLVEALPVEPGPFLVQEADGDYYVDGNARFCCSKDAHAYAALLAYRATLVAQDAGKGVENG